MAPAATTLPPDIQKILDDIDAADLAAERLVASLSEAQLRWQPDGGRRWSVVQCLEHLMVTNEFYGASVRRAVDHARRAGSVRQGPLRPGFFGRKFIESLEPPVRRRQRAPSKIKPGSPLSTGEILRRYREAHVSLRRSGEDAATIDANRATFPNPFFGLARVKVSTALLVVCAHDRRHLWQAEQVRGESGFPRHATAG